MDGGVHLTRSRGPGNEAAPAAEHPAGRLDPAPKVRLHIFKGRGAG